MSKAMNNWMMMVDSPPDNSSWFDEECEADIPAIQQVFSHKDNRNAG